MAPNGKGKIEYRLLRQDEWPKLVKFFEGEKGFVPPKEIGVASCAFDEAGNIVGALILQMVSYMGPLKIEPGYTGTVNYMRMKDGIDELFRNGKRSPLIIKGYIVMTEDEHIARMAEVAGMERAECVTLIQRFGENHL
jgi:hypothetical protein